jgi:hypothetical protein
LAEVSGAPEENIVVSYSHSHAAGWYVPDRFTLPGGEFIPAYLEELTNRIGTACQEALAAEQEAVITYATGHCGLAGNRDYWDAELGLYACGFNPDAPADDTVLVARVTDLDAHTIAVIVNYACHPTTLAWDNSLISPDYIGAMRAVVEAATGATCVFALGACGDLGPRHGFVGATAVADANGRQLGYAALATLESMDPPLYDFAYQGPVVSGATLGAWTPQPFAAERFPATSYFAGGVHTVDIPLKQRPDTTQLQQELESWLGEMAAAGGRGDANAAANASAHAERARRWIARVQDLPPGDTFPFSYSVFRMGDALWVTTGGEPYSALQQELRRRFPDHALLVSPLTGDLQVAYLLPQDRYGKGLYQEEPSILAPGCLELVVGAISARIEKLIKE